jgi:hypothetical protein
LSHTSTEQERLPIVIPEIFPSEERFLSKPACSFGKNNRFRSPTQKPTDDMLLQRLNMDNSWYLELSRLRLLIDPWLEGTEVDFFPWFNTLEFDS